MNMQFEWKDVEKKLEEDELKKEKTEELGTSVPAAPPGAQIPQAPGGASQATPGGGWESIGLAAVGYETWNEVAVARGAEPISDEQKRFLDARTRKLEEKWLRNIKLLPEIEAALGHVVVYLPKYVKYQKQKKDTQDGGAKT